jgi:hypothetical protein
MMYVSANQKAVSLNLHRYAAEAATGGLLKPKLEGKGWHFSLALFFASQNTS